MRGRCAAGNGLRLETRIVRQTGTGLSGFGSEFCCMSGPPPYPARFFIWLAGVRGGNRFGQGSRRVGASEDWFAVGPSLRRTDCGLRFRSMRLRRFSIACALLVYPGTDLLFDLPCGRRRYLFVEIQHLFARLFHFEGLPRIPVQAGQQI